MEDLRIVICTNVEHLQNALGIRIGTPPTVVRVMLTIWGEAIHDALRDAGYGFENGVLRTDARFNNWNGGRYDSQARAYGYQTRNVIAWRGVDDAIIDAALERAERALVQAEMELHESEGGITPGEARILDRIARDAGIVGD